jgi:hypothetical protein
VYLPSMIFFASKDPAHFFKAEEIKVNREKKEKED